MTRIPTVPDHWSPMAVQTFEEIWSARPDLAGAEVAQLEIAMDLLTMSAVCDQVAKDANYVAYNVRKELVIHPAVQEGRMHRQAAAQILSRLVPKEAASSASSAGASLAHKRWSK